MNTKFSTTILLLLVFFSSGLSRQCSAQQSDRHCIALREPLFAFSNGTIVYFAFRTEGICGEDCTDPTPVYHFDGPEFLDELPHNCQVGEGLQASIKRPCGCKRVYVNHSDNESDRDPLSLTSPVSSDYDFFTTWNAKTAPKLMRPGGELRHCTDCESSRNFTLHSPDGDEIKVRVFQVKVSRQSTKTRYHYVAYEREGGPGEGALQAAQLVRQQGTSHCYRFRIEDGKSSPYPEAEWILLMRAALKQTDA